MHVLGASPSHTWACCCIAVLQVTLEARAEFKLRMLQVVTTEGSTYVRLKGQ